MAGTRSGKCASRLALSAGLKSVSLSSDILKIQETIPYIGI